MQSQVEVTPTKPQVNMVLPLKPKQLVELEQPNVDMPQVTDIQLRDIVVDEATGDLEIPLFF